jgi:plasmid stabilization system protein ParE
MKLHWTNKALSDLVRLHDFLKHANPPGAAKIVQALTHATGRLSDYPRIGEQLDQFAPREVRRLLVGNYEMRNEIRDAAIYVLRVWHTREDR